MTFGKKAQALIMGGGPAGATAAMRLLAKGIRPPIVEREQFPRYHIGESMTGECGAIVREHRGRGGRRSHHRARSRPIGSRYRPERAAFWNTELDSVETTERWMREQD